MFIGQGRSLLRRSEIALAFASTNNADSANLRVGDLLILSQIRLDPPFGGQTTLISGFTNVSSIGYSDGTNSVTGRISCITVTSAQIGATFTQFQRMWALRDPTGPLRLDPVVRSTTGSYNASGLPAPVGFLYTVTRTNSTSPGTVGTVSGQTVSNEYNQSYVRVGAQCAIRLGFWWGNAPQQSYTLTVGTNPGSDVFREFHAIYRADT
jgi:hypothetical protein